jgi:outer membrane protein
MKFLAKSLCLTLLAQQLIAGEYGIVNFNTCLSESKKGKQEQTSLEELKKQFTSIMEEKDKQFQEIAQKLNDQEYMDGLSPDAEAELKNQYNIVAEEMNRYNNQYYQLMQQTNMRVMQQVNQEASQAAEKVAKDKKLFMVINKDACFYYNADFDITQAVIAEMDKRFESTSKTAATPAAK